VAFSAASSTLRLLLNRQDAPLGPWLVGRGPVDDALQAFSGAPGGPPSHPWEAGLPFPSGYASVFRQLQVDAPPPFTFPFPPRAPRVVGRNTHKVLMSLFVSQ